MGDKEVVLGLYPNAFCFCELGWYQIRVTVSQSPQHFESLSSQHPTERMAWHFAALRMRVAERAQKRCEGYKQSVSRAFPRAYCAVVSGKFFQIRRPRTGLDTRGLLDYIPVSGRFSSEAFAWQDAAGRVVESSEDGYMKLSASRNIGAEDPPGEQLLRSETWFRLQDYFHGPSDC